MRRSCFTFKICIFISAVFLVQCQGKAPEKKDTSTSAVKKDDSTCVKLPDAPSPGPVQTVAPSGPPTFEANIKPTITKVCASCHPSKAKSISNYAETEPFRPKMVQIALNEVQDANHNTTSIVISYSESRSFQDWEKAGYPQGDPSKTGNADPTCYDPFADILNPPEKAACDGQNLMFNRETKTCLAATLDMAWCKDADSVKSEFKKGYPTANSKTIDAEIDSKLAAGFTLDQCGKEGTFPVASFIKKITADIRIESVVLKFK